ncbi:phage portal protein [Litoribrevibacter albus]|uniref:Portal protein n=1 Tax=Litoribrevibacter albus TaxID=1473156 RepID=A0AA37SBW1_9GAMM|nr:phage portal protein [Litoribrevibacter albus]GLQ31656.1 portal protein [Litoribrevibacter albus]
MKLFGLQITRAKNADIIDTSEKLASALGGWSMSTSGVEINARNAMQIGTVFMCVRVLAESIGMLPLRLYEEVGGSKNLVSGVRLANLLRNGPNDFMTAQEWKECVVTHLCLRGNHYSYVNKVRGEPRELLPLNPDAVKPIINDDWTIEYEVTFPNKIKRTLSQNEILHIRLFSVDGVNGLGPIQWCRNGLGLAKATEDHGSRLFKNGAHPGGGFQTDQTLKDEQYNRLKDQLDTFNSEGAHKPLILEGGLKWHQISLSAEDAQFLETRKFQRAEICGMFRVPPHMIADLERATFSNIEHQSLDFVQSALMPFMTRIEHRLAKSLLKPTSNQYFKFNANALLRGDIKSRGEFYTKLQQAGALSPNEIRELEDMNPRDGGDVYLTPLNMAHDGKPIKEGSNNAQE